MSMLVVIFAIIGFFSTVGFILALVLPDSSNSQVPQQKVQHRGLIDYNLVHTLDFYNNRHGFKISDQAHEPPDFR